MSRKNLFGRRLVTDRWPGWRRGGILACVPRTRTASRPPDHHTTYGSALHLRASSARGACIRQLRRSPGFALVATLTVALGIAAVTAVFAVVDATILRPLPFQDPDRLVLVRRAQPGSKSLVETTYP